MNHDQMIEENMPLVVSIVNKFKPKNHTERQDWIDAGRIGLWKALQKLDTSKGTISTYAWGPIRWAILKELSKRRGPQSLNKLNPPSVPRLESLWEYIPDSITQNERKILELRLQGYKFREICAELNDTPYSTIKNRYYTALDKIRKGNNVE